MPRKHEEEKVSSEDNKIQLVTEQQLIQAKLDHIITLLEKQLSLD